MASPANGSDQATVTDLTDNFNSSTWATGLASDLAALLSGLKWGSGFGNGATLSFSFPGMTAAWASDYSGLVEKNSYSALSVLEQSAVRTALDSWAAVANITFNEIADGPSDVGLLRFAWTDQTQGIAAAWAYFPNSYYANGGDVWLSTATLGVTATDPADWQAGGSAVSVLIHELGHALGLKHPFDSEVYAPATLPTGQDTEQYTVMSYTAHDHGLYAEVTFPTENSWQVSVIPIQPLGPMVLDIQAIQYLYGANQTYHSGNDTYAFDPATPFLTTLWDAGGTDTISANGFTADCTIDLTPGAYSSLRIPVVLPEGYSGTMPTYDGTDNLGIAFDCWIENATGGDGNDTLVGNLENNTLLGGNGADSLSGGDGVDSLDGGSGSDTASYGSAGVRVIAGTASGAAIDWKIAEGTWIDVAGAETLTAIENLEGGPSGDALFGDAGANTLSGNGGADFLYGYGGNDQLSGGSESDNLSGGSGNDTLAGGLGNDVLAGGIGADMFLFDTAISGGANIDSVKDFVAGTDVVALENAIFSALGGTGNLNPAFMISGPGITQAIDANDYLIYDSTSGALYYDADGSAAGASAQQFAWLWSAPGSHPLMASTDFVVT